MQAGGNAEEDVPEAGGRVTEEEGRCRDTREEEDPAATKGKEETLEP